jgi:hypothetical protein
MEVASLSTLLLHAVRWVFIGTLGWYTLRSKSLTSSILLAMFLGIEVAEFFPDGSGGGMSARDYLIMFVFSY